jgi:hypothetical protein
MGPSCALGAPKLACRELSLLLDVVQRLLGYASIATTARYLHETAAAAAEVADLVGTLLDGAPDGRVRVVGEDRENET